MPVPACAMYFPSVYIYAYVYIYIYTHQCTGAYVSIHIYIYVHTFAQQLFFQLSDRGPEIMIGRPGIWECSPFAVGGMTAIALQHLLVR